MPDGEHKRLLLEALDVEAEGQRLLLDGDDERGRERMSAAAALYRRSWEQAPPESYGRLIGMLKAAIIAGDASVEAAYARAELPDPPPSPPAAYALALALLAGGDDVAAAAATSVMRGASDAFDRAAAGIVAIARGDEDGCVRAVHAITEDFEQRGEHLTGVEIADTALMLQRLAAARGIDAAAESPLLP